MLNNIFPKNTGDLYDSPIVQQTSLWSDVKTMMGYETLALNFNFRGYDSDVLVIIQRIDANHSFAYIPYGPEFEPVEEEKGPFLEELSEVLRDYLPKDCIMIRYDLCWESFWVEPDYFDRNGIWMGPPEKSVQEMRFNFNTNHWNIRKSASNVLPSNTLFLDLTKSDNRLLSSMKPKTRYNIGLSFRRGVEVRRLGMESIDLWYSLYTQTCIRNGIYLHDIDYFRAVLQSAEVNRDSATEVMLLVAEYMGEPLAALFLVISKDRAYYLYGASSGDRRNLMATYALQWSAITTAKERGCELYDMFGVSPGPDDSHPMYGLYRFKSGFGGEMFHTMGCWDYPLDIEKYNYLQAMIELNSQGYHVV